MICLPGIPDRITSRLTVDEHGCWLWGGTTTTSGYPLAKVDGRQRALPRVFFAAQHGLTCKALRVHVCEHSPICLNPAHMTRKIATPRTPKRERWSWINGLPASMADMISPEPNSGCWLWLGAVNPVTGYGHARLRLGSKRYAMGGVHRFVYILLQMPELLAYGEWLPRSLHVHHALPGCPKICCNPQHMTVKTAAKHASDHRRQEAAQGRGWHTAESKARSAAGIRAYWQRRREQQECAA